MHVNVPNGTRPEGTGHFFQLVDDRTHHRARASSDGASRKHGLERRCTGFIVVKLGGNVAHEMLHVGVGLNVKPVHVDGAGASDLRQIVAHQIHQHSVFSSLLLVADHRLSQAGGFLRIGTLRTGALDG